MNKKFLTTLFFLLLFTSKSLGAEFIGVIGAAVGEITNQKNEKLSNGSKIYYGDTINVKTKSNAQILQITFFYHCLFQLCPVIYA